MKVGATAFVVLTVAAFAATTGQAAAQVNALALALCRKVPDDQARLKCYDAAFDSVFAEREAKTKEDMPKPGAWRIEEQKSPIDDSPEVTAILKATEGDAFLVARCKERKTELLFNHPEFFIGLSRVIKVVLRINDAPAVTETWSTSSTGRAAFSQSAIKTLMLLHDNSRLFVRVFNFQGVQNDATFDLGTISEMREKISQTCKWPKP